MTRLASQLVLLAYVSIRTTNAAIHAKAVLSGASPVKGTVYFTQESEGQPVILTGHLRSLSPGYHGFHIHEYGNLTSGCASAGAHHNPGSKAHGAPSDRDRHVGDLGNVWADSLVTRMEADCLNQKLVEDLWRLF
ncbi:SOD_CuZN6 [Ramazzottius varieornatus]|uniref:SOD_CuZN6 n=1 Tax=Ramazzottius varieornatus TaxID=947166 RepID=A0A1D1USM6_RAMVA|nr:SOD_CuZN6 [Ramazzottius varieornatus]